MGRLVLEAIQDNQPYIFTKPALGYLMENRFKNIAASHAWRKKQGAGGREAVSQTAGVMEGAEYRA